MEAKVFEALLHTTYPTWKWVSLTKAGYIKQREEQIAMAMEMFEVFND